MIRNILLVFLLITSLATTAQRTNSSPYSFFGIGEEFNPVTVEQSAMGGIGVAFSHYKYLNFTNPAAYADLRYTTYSFGVLNNKLTIDNGTETQSTNSTSLSYFALAFPLGSKAGMSFGIQPVSSVGYSLSNTNADETEISLFSGDGGISRVYGSFGIKVFKGFSLGVEADYSFGNIENSVINQVTNVTLATKYKESTIVRGGSVTLGAQYKTEINKDLVLSIGTTYKIGNDLKVTGDEYLYSLTLASTGTEFGRDTISQSSISGNYKLPLKTNLGVGLGKYDKWYVGLEYENQDAIETTGFLNTTNAYRYSESNRFSLGGFYLPKINSISSYWERVTYRAGIRLEKTGLLVDGSGLNTNYTPIDDFGISFGLGLPLRQLSTLNMGFEFGERGTTDNNLIQENYFNFRLSLSLTDSKWFQKRKID
ncbi:hypothetical protein [Polaribacter sp. SA4-12]|uniref:hypothetical protein n=1 Tax=Polaribacter sp. SA4-12 TaxID=1312072 RepID=UPI000B3C7EE6|nr:hypothetical protein [Polaribacter sp. SA4-12]ARV16227.1 hypothetical protein BTO07_14215 [Polaribacter sp. SA4-12]